MILLRKSAFVFRSLGIHFISSEMQFVTHNSKISKAKDYFLNATTTAYNTYNVLIISEPSHPMAFQAMSQTHYG